MLLELTGKGGVVGEAAVIAKVSDRNGGSGEKGFGQQEPFAVDVLVDAVASVGLEFTHHIVFAEKYLFSQVIDGEVIGEMAVDVVQELLDLGVIGNAGELLQFLGHDGAV